MQSLVCKVITQSAHNHIDTGLTRDLFNDIPRSLPTCPSPVACSPPSAVPAGKPAPGLAPAAALAVIGQFETQLARLHGDLRALREAHEALGLDATPVQGHYDLLRPLDVRTQRGERS